MFQSFAAGSDPGASAGRVAHLRRMMTQQGLTGFIIPRRDAHGGEAVAPCDRRLAWLTGFTGSAGEALILMDRAQLFVDGRYVLQAERQCDPEVFSVAPSVETPIEKWLESEAKPDDVIGIDPWLHGWDEADCLRKSLETAGAKLVFATENPVDSIWKDRPPPPTGTVRIHPPDFAGETGQSKRRRLGAELRKEGTDAAFLNMPDSLAWLVNIRGSDIERVPVALGFGLLQADGSLRLYMNPAAFDAALREHLGDEVTVEPVAKLDDLWSELAGKTVLLDATSGPAYVADRLAKAGASPVRGRDPCTAAKAVKNPAELAGMRRAHVRDGVAMVRFLHWLDTHPPDPAPTEIACVKRLEKFRVEAGVDDIAFDTICGAGPNGAMIHYRVTNETDRALAPGETLLIDGGGQYPDGTTDITRTVAFIPGKSKSKKPKLSNPDIITPFTQVLRGMITLSRARWPEGLTGRDIDPLARSALWSAGRDYAHGTGHGVGAALDVHEGPATISRKGKIPLAPGMILSNEPGYYREDAFGVRIENLVAVSPPAPVEGGDTPMLGFETLTLCPIDCRLIDPALMEGAEIDWLDAYHARVAAELAPLLGEAEAAWLRSACAPLIN